MDSSGYYDKSIPNTIYINKRKTKDEKELIVIHELNHLIQNEYGKFFSFKDKTMVDAYKVDSINYWDYPEEIDSRIVEVYFCCQKYGFSKEVIELLKPHLFRNGLTVNTKAAFNGIINTAFKKLLFV